MVPLKQELQEYLRFLERYKRAHWIAWGLGKNRKHLDAAEKVLEARRQAFLRCKLYDS